MQHFVMTAYNTVHLLGKLRYLFVCNVKRLLNISVWGSRPQTLYYDLKIAKLGFWPRKPHIDLIIMNLG